MAFFTILVSIGIVLYQRIFIKSSQRVRCKIVKDSFDTELFYFVLKNILDKHLYGPLILRERLSEQGMSRNLFSECHRMLQDMTSGFR